ncbi:hypothetical protein Ddye_019722 [Dipteronia dyeriana]|uniref:Uncharacterized protein n=1 Tax=Dipteronia dyeriana TaxID=168575 RepID=A0AAD9TYM3_9ROSI|nr:hypothetical protein Ddye_019722 [Dipteronia dyeriana]
MASLQASSCLVFSSSSCSSRRRVITGAISVPKLPKISLFTQKITQSRELLGLMNQIPIEKIVVPSTTIQQLDRDEECNRTAQLCAILEAVCDRVEMHNNIGEQRNNWNTLLLNSINMITLTAAAMSGFAVTGCEVVFFLIQKPPLMELRAPSMELSPSTKKETKPNSNRHRSFIIRSMTIHYESDETDGTNKLGVVRSFRSDYFRSRWAPSSARRFHH